MRGPPQDGSFACFASQVAALSGEEEGGAQSALDGGRTLLPLCRSSCIPRHEVSGGGRRGDRPRSSGRVLLPRGGFRTFEVSTVMPNE